MYMLYTYSTTTSVYRIYVIQIYKLMQKSYIPKPPISLFKENKDGTPLESNNFAQIMKCLTRQWCIDICEQIIRTMWQCWGCTKSISVIYTCKKPLTNKWIHTYGYISIKATILSILYTESLTQHKIIQWRIIPFVVLQSDVFN
jgi:hypothetical protein